MFTSYFRIKFFPSFRVQMKAVKGIKFLRSFSLRLRARGSPRMCHVACRVEAEDPKKVDFSLCVMRRRGDMMEPASFNRTPACHFAGFLPRLTGPLQGTLVTQVYLNWDYHMSLSVVLSKHNWLKVEFGSQRVVWPCFVST